MSKENTKEIIKQKIEQLRPKHYRTKFALALVILILVSVGLNTTLFISWGWFNFTSHPPVRIQFTNLQIPIIEQIGFNVDEFENDINRLVSNMNNAQQGTHFLMGMISGLIFSQPMAGLSVGIIKEAYDFTTNYRAGHLNKGYFFDAITDTSFWLAGGIVGFYILSGLYDLFRTHKIRSVRKLFSTMRKGVVSRLKSLK